MRSRGQGEWAGVWLVQRCEPNEVRVGLWAMVVDEGIRLQPYGLLSPLPPKPDSQDDENNEGQDADPERDADISRSHLHPEEDSEQLCEGDEPEEDRDDKRCWPVVHPNLLGPLE